MTKLSVNIRILNTYLSFYCQRRSNGFAAAGFYSLRQSCQFKPTLISTLKLTKPSNCGCLTKSYCGVSNGSTLYTPSVASRHYVSSADDKQPELKPSLYQRFKTMYRDYWYVLLPVHLVTSAAWFGGFFYMASSGVDIVAVLEQLNVSETFINPFRNGHATKGHLAISYALYKIATPLRYTVTLGGTTVSINYLKQWGYIKPVPTREQLKELYEGKKEQIMERGQSLKHNMMQSLKPTENN